LPTAEAYWFLFVTPCWFSHFFVYFKKQMLRVMQNTLK